MTDAQISVARQHVEPYTKLLGYPKANMQFLTGYIEDLRRAGVPDGTIDIAISNCVVNLAPDKRLVLKAVYDSLAVGGEFYFSDVYCDRRLPEDVRQDKVLWGECLSGALYVEDFKRLCREVGFTDPRVLSTRPMSIDNAAIADKLGNAQFSSIQFRLFKLPNLETLCEDYGQVAVYKGTITEHKHGYQLDDHHWFPTGKPVLVCGNTADMVGASWLKEHFTITGNRNVHFGLFPCGPSPASAGPAAGSGGGSCC